MSSRAIAGAHRTRFLGAVLLVVLGLLLGPIAVPAAAQDTGDGLSLEVEAGYDGFYKAHQWLPVFVRATNDGPSLDEAFLRIVVGSRAANTEVVYEAPVSLPTRSDKRVTLFIYLPGFSSRLTVSLHDGTGRTVLEAESSRLDSLGPDDLLYGVVGGEEAALDFLENIPGERSDAAVAILDGEDLPEVGAAWSALDVIVFANVDAGRLSATQHEALRAWVGLGGQLIVSGGSNWAQTTAGLEDILPVNVSGTRSVTDLPALSAFAGARFRDPGPYVIATSSLKSGGSILLHEGDVPLLARQPFGRGAVTFLALDPGQAPLLDWTGREPLWASLAKALPRTPAWGSGPINSYAATSAVGALPDLVLPSTVWLVVFLGLYVMVIGPVNYFLLRRMRRPELSWFTIPAVIVFFSLLAYVTGFSLRGNSPIINQLSIAYGALDGEEARVHTLLGYYSPRRTSYNVTLPADALVRPFSNIPTAVSGLQGQGSQDAIAREEDVTISNMRVDVSGIETYLAEHYRPLPAVAGNANLSLQGSRSRLEVTVQNNGNIVLENAGLLIGSVYVKIGDLDPGESRTVDQTLSRNQTSAAASTSSGTGIYTSGSPLSPHYDEILGTTSYRYDAAVAPRFQLLESLSAFGPAPSRTSYYPSGSVTLVAWTDTPLLETAFEGRPADQYATTLYFLEIPFAQITAAGEGVTVPSAMFDWQILDNDNVYAFAPESGEVFMPANSELTVEFQPWSLFRGMAVEELSVIIDRAISTPAGEPAPTVSLWNWEEEAWDELADRDWGRLNIIDWQPYVDDQLRVRLRVENETGVELTLDEIAISLTGDLP